MKTTRCYGEIALKQHNIEFGRTRWHAACLSCRGNWAPPLGNTLDEAKTFAQQIQLQGHFKNGPVRLRVDDE